MRRFGLIGYPIGHSFSKKFFTMKFDEEQLADVQYDLFELPDIQSLDELLDTKGLLGLNVTIPYKQKVIPWLDELHPVARELQTVNCIKIIREGKQMKTLGYNTDVSGFQKSLSSLDMSPHKNALIMGTGGSSKAVRYVLDALGIQSHFVSRKPATDDILGYPDLDQEIIEKHTFIINTTPLGMYPEVNSCPSIPYQFLTTGHLLYDLVYNPLETEFLKKGKAMGTQTKNGMEMLVQQAESSWSIWNE